MNTLIKEKIEKTKILSKLLLYTFNNKVIGKLDNYRIEYYNDRVCLIKVFYNDKLISKVTTGLNGVADVIYNHLHKDDIKDNNEFTYQSVSNNIIKI